jgi:hypothetical protein
LLANLNLNSFHSCPLSSLTFESPSHLGTFTIDLSTDFCVTELDIPSSVCFVAFAVRAPCRSVVVHFPRDSRLCTLACYRQSAVLATPRVFARLSERTLKYFRELFSSGE